MEGTGVPLVTPFDEKGDIDESKLAELVGWVEERGVDFIVPCGSNSEAELMTAEERARVVEIVVESASVPILAGTGHPGLRESTIQTELAASAGADAALIVTPFYFSHSQEDMAIYYKKLAEWVSIPVYLYSVPKFTHVSLEPDTIAELSDDENIKGMKDSSGNSDLFQQEVEVTKEKDFDMLVGAGGIYAQALEMGATGGVLALANIAPEKCSEIYQLYKKGDNENAKILNDELVELNRGVTGTYGISGLKAAMEMRGAPAGFSRSPHRGVGGDEKEGLQNLLDEARVQ
ncbi:MAG TPA: dihydrodipicolinate synthase family protein [Halobacteriales archaeon]|uniref:dihydrodipicolinate synthase family protein n=1 Tax=Candidatus Hikarchaeum yamanae TaxID=2675326 RepID=UPI001847D870|nr:dihydrodipicolinate synthase family protein [Halobacteriales archaeon]|tara:strand:+ start:1040 stop:1909 length:870 start_codon:yes stop_codon:yes gene_type:complete